MNFLRSKNVLVGPRDLSGRPTWEVAIGDALTRLREIPSRSVDSCVTSPAYWGLRDYGTATWQGGSAGCPHAEIRRTTSAEFSARWGTTRGESASGPTPIRGPVCAKCGAVRLRDQQMGSEPTLAEWVRAHVVVFEEVKRVLKDHGTLWLNIGDAYAAGGRGGQVGKSTLEGGQKSQAASKKAGRPMGHGLKPKDLLLMPERLALALQDAGWWVRGRNIWAKPSYLPESVTDRAVKSHEHVWLLSKSARYYYDTDAVRTDHADKTFSARTPRTGNGGGDQRVLSNKFVQVERLNDPRGANLRDVWNLDPEKTHADHGEPHDDELASIDEEIAALEHGMANARRDLDRFFDSTVVAPPPEDPSMLLRFGRAENASAEHPAMFPVTLPTICIKAGTSLFGVCKDCGKPFVRVVRKEDPDRARQRAAGGDAAGEYVGEPQKNLEGATATGLQAAGDVKASVLAGMLVRETIGWRPSCSRRECPRCHGDGVTIHATIGGHDGNDSALPDTREDRCTSCDGSGWWWETCAEMRERTAVTRFRARLHRDPAHGIFSCAGCKHDAFDHSPAGYTCSRCNCGRLRFTRDVDNAIPATVLDCFSGMATTGIAARRLGRYYRGIELNPKYARSSGRRLERDAARRSFGGEKPKTEREAKARLAQGNLFERSSRS